MKSLCLFFFQAMRKQQQNLEDKKVNYMNITTGINNSNSIKKKNGMLEKKERNKAMNTIASKMKCVVEKMIENGKSNNIHQEITIFIFKSNQNEIIYSFLQEIRKENSELFQCKEKFFQVISEKYNEMVLSLNHKPLSCSSSNTLFFSKYLVP